MSGADHGIVSGELAWYLALILFGIVYNAITAWAEKEGYLEGFTWLAVVVGVAVTLILTAPIIGAKTFGLLFSAFACSGLPMCAGALARYLKRRKAYLQSLRSEGHGNTTETLADER